MENREISEEIIQEARPIQRSPLEFVEEELFKAFDTSYELYRNGEREQRSNIALYERSLETINKVSEAFESMDENEIGRALEATDPENSSVSILDYDPDIVHVIKNLSDDELDFVAEEIFKSSDRLYESYHNGSDTETEIVQYNEAMHIITAFQNLRELFEYERIQQAKEIQDMLRDN